MGGGQHAQRFGPIRLQSIVLKLAVTSLPLVLDSNGVGALCAVNGDFEIFGLASGHSFDRLLAVGVQSMICKELDHYDIYDRLPILPPTPAMSNHWTRSSADA